MPELKELLEEILPLKSWKEVDKHIVTFRRRAKFVPKKNVLYHMYKAQEVKNSTNAQRMFTAIGGRLYIG